MRPLLFLDVDGVLNSEAWFWRRDGDPLWEKKQAARDLDERHRLFHLLQIDPSACARMQTWCERFGVDVVLSSTWRLLGGLEYVGPVFAERGFSYPMRDVTPSMSPDTAVDYERSDTQRGLEIEWWILCHVPQNERPDLRIVILDDDSDMGRLSPWLVKTSWKTGLENAHGPIMEQTLQMPLGSTLDDLSPYWTPAAVRYLRSQGAIR